MLKVLKDTIHFYYSLIGLPILFFSTRKTPPKLQQAFLLAPYMPPRVNGGVYRPLPWLKYSGDNNWQLTVFTKHVSGSGGEAGKHLFKQLPDGALIRYIKPSLLEPSWRLTPKVDGNILTALEIAKQALREIDLNEQKPSVIVATGPSFDFFIAAYWISKAADIPLVIDYRDEWTQNPFPFVTVGRDDRKWEQRIFKHARNIIFTTPSMLEHQANSFKRKNGLCVIYNGWEESEVSLEKRSFERDGDEIKLVYAGVLAEHSNPKSFFNSILKLPQEIKKRIKITLLGDMSSDMENVVSHFSKLINIQQFASVSRNKAINIMSECDYLLLFATPNMKRYIPGKLFDYASSGTPILAYGHEGEITNCIYEGKLGVFCPEGDCKKLTSILLNNERNYFKDCHELRNKWLKTKSRKYQAKAFFDLLNRV
jgi:hypothetical protein